MAVARSFAALGNQERGEDLLSAMEDYNYSGRVTWLIFIGKVSNSVFGNSALGSTVYTQLVVVM